MILRDRDVTVDPFCDNVVGLVFGDLFPLNMYQTAVHRGERLESAPVERVEQPEFSKEERTEGAPTSRDQETISSPNTMTTPPTMTLMIF